MGTSDEVASADTGTVEFKVVDAGPGGESATTALVTTGFGVSGEEEATGAGLATPVKAVTLVGSVFATSFGVEDEIPPPVGDMPVVPPVAVEAATAAEFFFFLWDDL